ncbi:MAG: adenosylmethionine decarboxylase [Planctomycetota bacterium]|jgi:S-adenosylmethionine decarboxylase|nr:adenosylmethionine decarboxylase [Planctomycetota bacterium]
MAKAVKPLKKLKLAGFNNLTKSLSFNLYDVCWAKTAEEKQGYIAYINDEYNARRWTEILTRTAEIIGANILNVARQDYEPQGASVTVLISEEPVLEQSQLPPDVLVGDETPQIMAGHLDKSHICVHTYPEAHPDNGICTFRADVEVSTCGRISPLHALNYLMREFEPDVLNLDYRVRGFTRDVSGRKHWIDHRINSIQNFIDGDLRDIYHCIDVNVYQENLFHTKLMYKKLDLDRYLFGGKKVRSELKPEERKRIKRRLKREIEEIFYSRSMA